MADGLQIKIGADVSQAVAGLKQVDAAATKSATTLQKMAPSVSKATGELAKLPGASNQATQALTNLSRVAQDAPYGFIGIANNLNPLLESFQRLKASTGTTGGALKALGKELGGAGGIGLALGVASSLAVVFGDRLFGASKAAKEAKTSADSLKDSITGIFQESAKEAASAAAFVGILKNETETRERKLSAIKELQKIQPEVFANLKLEGNAVVGLDNAYKNYLDNLKTVIAVKIKQAQLEQLIGTLLEKQGVTLTQSEKKIKNFVDAVKKSQLDRAKATGGGEAQSFVESILGTEEQNKKDVEKIKSDIDALISDISQLSKGVKVPELKIKPDKVDFEGQFAKIVYLKKPIFIQGRIFDFNAAQEGTDLLKKLEYEFSDRLKSMEKLVVTPKLNIAPSVAEGNKKLLEQFNELKRNAEFVAGSISSAFTDAFTQIAEGKNAFHVLGEAIKKVVVDLIRAAIQAIIFKSIMNLILPGSGSASSGLGSLLGNFGGFRAKGGPVSAGKAFVVGEDGPEVFTPSVSGSIIPNNRVGSFMGGGFGSGFPTRDRQYIRGNNLVLVTARTNRSQSRLG